MSVCTKNSCAGGYGNCLDVKITNACNGACEFCIEHGGYTPDETDVKQLALQTIQSNADNVLILGGEPTIYPNLKEYLSLIRPWKKKIYMTTNGSQFKSPFTLVRDIAPYLDGVNLSIHHYSERLNDAVYKTCHVCFDELRQAIQIFHDAGVSVRINTTLTRGKLDNKSDIDCMVAFAQNYLHADEIRFSELQNCEKLWVDATKLFPGLPDNPYEQGCEQVISEYMGILVRVKMTCGRVNRLKAPVMEDPIRTGGYTEVLYPNGKRTNGWIFTTSSARGVIPSGCHNVVRGCH